MTLRMIALALAMGVASPSRSIASEKRFWIPGPASLHVGALLGKYAFSYGWEPSGAPDRDWRRTLVADELVPAEKWIAPQQWEPKNICWFLADLAQREVKPLKDMMPREAVVLSSDMHALFRPWPHDAPHRWKVGRGYFWLTKIGGFPGAYLALPASVSMMPFDPQEPATSEASQVGAEDKQHRYTVGAKNTATVAVQCDNNWTVDLSGTEPKATAPTPHESLAKLAWDITGNPGDASQLGVSFPGGKVPANTEIPIKPLLDILEEKLRNNIAVATTGITNAKFGGPEGQNPGIVLAGKHEAEINLVYEPYNNDTAPLYSCAVMGAVIQTRGVITTLASAPNGGTFDQLFPGGATTIPAVSSMNVGIPDINDIKMGDWIAIENKPDYDDETTRRPNTVAWANNENVTAICPGWFSGWMPNPDPGTQGIMIDDSYDGWLETLMNAYNLTLRAGLRELRSTDEVEELVSVAERFEG